MEVIHMVSEKRMQWTTQKFIAEGQVCSAEEHLEALRQELVEVGKDLQEIETSLRTLQDLIWQTLAPEENNDPQLSLYHSDESDATGSESSSVFNE